MAIGSMSYTEMRACAEELGTEADNMDKIFENLKKEMNSLETVLKSRGGDELYSTYKILEAKLDGFPNKLRDFQAFVTTAVDQYESDDAALASDVG